MVAYKLLRLRADGTLGPLFINRRQRIPMGRWLKAECHPTKGFAVRPGWHVTWRPDAPHLSKRGRVWCVVDIKHYTAFERPLTQGGTWYIAKYIRIVSRLT